MAELTKEQKETVEKTVKTIEEIYDELNYFGVQKDISLRDMLSGNRKMKLNIVESKFIMDRGKVFFNPNLDNRNTIFIDNLGSIDVPINVYGVLCESVKKGAAIASKSIYYYLVEYKKDFYIRRTFIGALQVINAIYIASIDFNSREQEES